MKEVEQYAETEQKAELPPCTEVDPEIFFPPKAPGRSRSILAAKAICSGCDMRLECLKTALDGDRIGVWGGTTESERAAIRRSTTRNSTLRR